MTRCGGDGGAYSVLELTEPKGCLPAGVFMFADRLIWHSVDSGRSFNLFKTVSNDHWRNNSTDSFFEESVLFIVFEWAAGGDLKKVIREAAGADKPGSKPSRLDEAVIWSYFSQMAEGLRYMHDLRMMHRDMKPANVFINGNGKLKLGDMGLGRQLSEDHLPGGY